MEGYASREEYYQAYPKADADGWIEHDGLGVPVGFGTLVDVRLRGGEVVSRQSLTSGDSWGHSGGCLDIIAYRPHKPEVNPELCESAMRGIPDPEEKFSDSTSIPRINQCRCKVVDIKPTIEQLARDYRNAKDYAERLQWDANKALVAAESAMCELIDAGNKLGLTVIPHPKNTMHNKLVK